MVLRLVGRSIGAKPLPFWAPFGFHFVFYNSRQKMWSSFCVFLMLLGVEATSVCGSTYPIFLLYHKLEEKSNSGWAIFPSWFFGFMGRFFGFMGRFFIFLIHGANFPHPHPFVYYAQKSPKNTRPVCAKCTISNASRVSSITML